MERGSHQEPTGEASHQLSAQDLHADHRLLSVAHSRNAAHRLGGPAGIWGDPHDGLGHEMGQQQQHAPHHPIHLQPALPEDQFVQAFGEPRRMGRAVPSGQGRAAQVASSATSSLNASEQSAFAPAGGCSQSLPSTRPLRMAAHRRGGGGGDAEQQDLPAQPGAPGAGAHADFLAFPWPELLEMVDEQERQPPDAATTDWQRQH